MTQHNVWVGGASVTIVADVVGRIYSSVAVVVFYLRLGLICLRLVFVAYGLVFFAYGRESAWSFFTVPPVRKLDLVFFAYASPTASKKDEL